MSQLPFLSLWSLKQCLQSWQLGLTFLLSGFCPFSECMLLAGVAAELSTRNWPPWCMRLPGTQNPPDLKIPYNSVMVLLPSRLWSLCGPQGWPRELILTTLFSKKAAWFTLGIPKAGVAGHPGWYSAFVTEGQGGDH